MTADDALLLVVDAIPWSVAREVWEAGLLPGFVEPRPLISTFPSLTNVAVPALLHAALPIRPPGYEAIWVEPRTRALRGRMGRLEDEPGFAPFHGRPEGTMEMLLEYAFREAAVRRQVQAFVRDFLDDGAPWLGYLPATDAVGHFDGRDALLDHFATIARTVVEALDAHELRHGRRPAVVLCSDHGMAFDVQAFLRARDVADRLVAAGLERGAPHEDGFQIAALGDVGSGAVWCSPRRASDVADLLLEHEGVDLCALRTEHGVEVRNRRGRARLAWIGRRYRYDHDGSDPLRLEPFLVGLRSPTGWIDGDAVFAATWDAPYPNPLARIRRGLGNLVRHPAQVLFSMAPGWTWGPHLTHRAAELVGSQVGTHGALERVQSQGFVAAAGEHPGVTALAGRVAVRAEEVFRDFRGAVLRGRAQRSETLGGPRLRAAARRAARRA